MIQSVFSLPGPLKISANSLQRDMLNIIVKLILLIVVTAKNCSCDDDETSDIKGLKFRVEVCLQNFLATINILPLMNRIIDLKKTPTDKENSTIGTTTSTTTTSSTLSSTSTTKLETMNSTSEDPFGSISLKSTNFTISNLTENAIRPNDTERNGNTTVTSEITGETQEKKSAKHSELKNCPWITWFGIAFGFIIVCCKFLSQYRK